MHEEMVELLRRHFNDGKTKAESVRLIALEYPDIERRSALPAIQEGLGMSPHGASTYFNNYIKNKQAAIESPVVDALALKITTDSLRQQLESTAEMATNWYMERTQPIQREVFVKKRGLSDDGRGAVYSYHNEDESAMYVGITGYRVKSRLNTPTSPHKKKAWWAGWGHMRFLPLSSRSEREALEHLLILGLMPEHNRKPSFIDFETFLDQH